MNERETRDDLFLDTLEHDEELAWQLAEAAARPAPAALRARIVARHRRRGIFGLPAPLPTALAFAVLALVVLPLSLILAQTRADIERERAIAAEYERALVAVATGGRVVTLDARPPAAGRGSVVVAATGEAYLVLAVPAPPPGKAYEAWVIRTGPPIPAGLAPAREGVVVVALTHVPRSGDTVAVTLESAAGAQQPTTDPLLAGRF